MGQRLYFCPLSSREADYAGEKRVFPNDSVGQVNRVGRAKLDKERSHVMLCGNPINGRRYQRSLKIDWIDYESAQRRQYRR